MKRVLVTGMSGTGKSALLNELATRGYRTVDTDYGDYLETVDGERLRTRTMNSFGRRPEELAAILADLEAVETLAVGEAAADTTLRCWITVASMPTTYSTSARR